jgi:hypothetical protein
MGNKINITETEKNKIRILYEQKKPIQKQEITNIFSNDEINFLRENVNFSIEKDQFNGEIEISGGGKFVFFKAISNGGVRYDLMIYSRIYNKTDGVFILFKDGSRINKPNATIESGRYSSGFIFGLSKNEIDVFKTKQITYTKIGGYQTQILEEDDSELKTNISLIQKINKENYEIVESFLNEKQETPVNYNTSNETPVKTIEIPPDFPGGDYGLNNYIKNSLKNKLPKSTYKINIEIIIGKDGTVKEIKQLSSGDNDFFEIIKNIFKNGPKWKPGIKNGQPSDTNLHIEKNITL